MVLAAISAKSKSGILILSIISCKDESKIRFTFILTPFQSKLTLFSIKGSISHSIGLAIVGVGGCFSIVGKEVFVAVGRTVDVGVFSGGFVLVSTSRSVNTKVAVELDLLGIGTHAFVKKTISKKIDRIFVFNDFSINYL